MRKLETSKQLSAPPPERLREPTVPPERPQSAAKSVHFDAAPAIIPDRDDAEEDEDYGVSQDYDPNAAVVLYDFSADGDDELSVAEGEDLIVLERDSDDWWKVRNSKGREGVVPASYVEVRSRSSKARTNTKSVPSCGIHLLRMMRPAGRMKQSLRLNRKPKPRQPLRKRGVREKKRKQNWQQRRSEPGRPPNALKTSPWPTRTVETRRRPRGRRERRNWLPKRKTIQNHNRACGLFPCLHHD